MTPRQTKKRVLRHVLRDLYSVDARVRWNAVREVGELAVVRAAPKTRELLRRLAWSLNEESGATGWGAPEAMGEILANAPDHRSEFEGHFLGYLSDQETFLDNPVLDSGTLWAMGRLGRGPNFDADMHAASMERFLKHPEASVRGLAAWSATRLGLATLEGSVAGLSADGASVWLLLDGEVVERTVAELSATE